MFDLNTHLQFAVHGGGDSDGIAGAVAGLLAFIENLVRLSPGDIFVEVLPGLSVMENLHPLFVHFPLALLSLFFMLDVVGSVVNKPNWRNAASWFLVCGTFFAALTVTAGLLAAGTVAHGDDVHEVMENHEHLGILVLVLAIVLTVWRVLSKELMTGAANTLFQLFGFILFGLLILTADLGGLMVYKYGVAVEPVSQINQQAAALHEHGVEIDSPKPLEKPESSTLQLKDVPPEHTHHHKHNHVH